MHVDTRCFCSTDQWWVPLSFNDEQAACVQSSQAYLPLNCFSILGGYSYHKAYARSHNDRFWRSRKRPVLGRLYARGNENKPIRCLSDFSQFSSFWASYPMRLVPLCSKYSEDTLKLLERWRLLDLDHGNLCNPVEVSSDSLTKQVSKTQTNSKYPSSDCY